MVSSCLVPECKDSKRKREAGVKYYRFPVKDVERCKQWLRAVQNPKYDVNTPVCNLKNLRVCSLHFPSEDYDMRSEIMRYEEGRKLKPTAVPSINLGTNEDPKPSAQTPLARGRMEGSDGGEVSPTATEFAAVSQSTPTKTKRRADQEPFGSAGPSLSPGLTRLLSSPHQTTPNTKPSLSGAYRALPPTWTQSVILASIDWSVRNEEPASSSGVTILEGSRQCQEQTQNTSLEDGRKAEFAAPQQIETQRSANKPLESTEADVPSIEVSLDTDTEAFRKNIGVMTRPFVKDFGTNTDVLSKDSDLHVARDCLLQLFQVCSMCGFGTNARIQEEMGRFAVIQECQICSHQREWWSHSPTAETEVMETAKGKGARKEKKADREDKKQDMEDVCTLIMEFTSELFGRDVASDEEDQMPSDDDDVPEESSDEWCPSDEEGELFMDSDSSENLELDEPSNETAESEVDMKLVEWCVDCAEEAKLTCTTQRHKKLHACGMCVREEAVGFDKFYMRFDNLEGFLEHVKGEHYETRLPLCTECGVLVPRKKSHLCEHKAKKYICLDCGKRCTSKRGLLIHKGSHRLERTYPCKFCLKSFQTKLDKHNHEKSHTGEKRPYRCSECSERFSNIHKRNNHLRTHGKLKRHLCLTCLKEFTNLTNMERHMRVHTGEKPFVCEVCQRSFNQEGHLNSHMRIHTGELPFTCAQCGKGFNHNVSLKNHVQRYHKPESSSKDQGESRELDSVSEPQCVEMSGEGKSDEVTS